MNIYLEALKRASANSSTKSRHNTKAAVQRFQQLHREVETGDVDRAAEYLEKDLKKKKRAKKGEKKEAPGFGKPRALKQAATAILPPADIQKAIIEGRKKGISFSDILKNVQAQKQLRDIVVKENRLGLPAPPPLPPAITNSDIARRQLNDILLKLHDQKGYHEEQKEMREHQKNLQILKLLMAKMKPDSYTYILNNTDFSDPDAVDKRITDLKKLLITSPELFKTYLSENTPIYANPTSAPVEFQFKKLSNFAGFEQFLADKGVNPNDFYKYLSTRYEVAGFRNRDPEFEDANHAHHTFTHVFEEFEKHVAAATGSASTAAASRPSSPSVFLSSSGPAMPQLTPSINQTHIQEMRKKKEVKDEFAKVNNFARKDKTHSNLGKIGRAHV